MGSGVGPEVRLASLVYCNASIARVAKGARRIPVRVAAAVVRREAAAPLTRQPQSSSWADVLV